MLAGLSLGWAIFMLWGCLNESGSSGGLIARFFPFLRGFAHLDKLVHAGLHGVLASLLWWTVALHPRPPMQRGWWRWPAGLRAGQAWAIVLLCAAYGGVIEGLQAALTRTRGAEWLDALANFSGALLAVGLWQLLSWLTAQAIAKK